MDVNPPKLLMILLSLIMTEPSFADPAQPKKGDCQAVILLHGLARTKASMASLENNLKRQGFAVINMGYPSRSKPIQMLSETIIPRAVKLCKKKEARQIHFVTHSMGGILVRDYLSKNRITGLGRVVMLSPPNHGSDVVEKFKDISIFKWFHGPAWQQLGTAPDSVPNRLPAPDYEVGVITGDRSVNPILSFITPGKDDGKVSVESARLEGMKDFLVVHSAHPFIMNDPIVHDQVCTFLLTGRFKRNRSSVTD